MRKITKMAKVVCFIVFTIVLFEFFSYITYPGNGITIGWEAFYKKEKNSIDTLIVGSSHAYSSFSPEIISQYLGGNTFILASNSQNVAQTYYNVKEALNYQKPKRIILEAFSINSNDNWKDSEDRDWKKESNIDGMRSGLIKLQAVMNQYNKENWAYAYLKLGRTHGNWMNVGLLQTNFYQLLNPMTEYTGYLPSVSSMSDETIKKYEKRKYNKKYKFNISETNVEHFKKLVELCEKKDIELVVIMAPMYDKYIQSFDYSKRYEAVKELVEGVNVRYIDLNLEYGEIGLTAQDFEDAYNTYHHLNHQGAEKVTLYVMEKLMYD